MLLLLILRPWFHFLLLASSALSSTFFRLFLHPRYSTLSLFSPAPRAAALRSDARWCSSCCWPLPKKKKKEKKIDYSTTIIAPVSGCLSLGLFSNIFSILFIFPSLPLRALRSASVLRTTGISSRAGREIKLYRAYCVYTMMTIMGPEWMRRLLELNTFSSRLLSFLTPLCACCCCVWHNRENEKSHRRRLLSRCCSDFESIKKLTS